MSVASEGSEEDVDVFSANQIQKSALELPPIKISVNNLWLHEESPLLAAENVPAIFVEWQFLDVPEEECETPNSLPRPTKPAQTRNFNYSTSMYKGISEVFTYWLSNKKDCAPKISKNYPRPEALQS